MRLVVLRGVGAACSAVLPYVSSVVKEAAKDRRNVRVSYYDCSTVMQISSYDFV